MNDVNPYLAQEVASASPIQLRWMLVKRAEELCGLVEQFWATGDAETGKQWGLRIREILGELLDGIQDRQNPVSQQLSDFYVFLLKLLTRAEDNSDLNELRTLRKLLKIEEETWSLAATKFSADDAEAADISQPSDSLDGNITRADRPIAPPTSTDYGTELSGGFSLEV